MNQPQELMFQNIFNHLSEPRVVVKANTPVFTIVACNDAFKKVSNIIGRDIIGKGIKEVHNTGGDNAAGDTIIQQALEQAIATQTIVKLEAVRFDIPGAKTGESEQNWWQAEYTPMPGADNTTEYLICTTHNITDQIIGKKFLERAQEQEAALQREKALTEELTASNNELQLSEQNLAQLNSELEARVASRTKALALSEDNFRNIILQAPVAMGFFAGEEMVLEVINDKFLELWDKPNTIIGKPLLEALPELKGQPYLQIMQNVLSTGEAYYGKKSKVMLRRHGVLEEGYYNFINHAFKNAEGDNTGIIVVATEVTEQVIAYQNQQLLNEELATINEELEASNEQLGAANEELAETHVGLENAVQQLTASEARFRTLVQQAPVAICIFNGRELLIETANEKMQKLLGKNENIIGQTFAAAVPELEGQPFFQLLDNVFTTGEIYYANEDKAVLEKDGKLTDGYYNFIYQPVKDKNGGTTAVMVVATDVTEQVLTRKKVERAEQMLRMATDSAELGTWYIDAQTREFVASPRLKELFGFYPDEEMPYDAAVSQIHNDYRSIVINAVEASIQQQIKFDMEYPIIGFHDGKVRWIKAAGNFNNDIDGKQGTLAGVLREITEQKLDEIRKNDFIAMVSHELKTPLTSLKAYVQLITTIVNRNNDTYTAEVLKKANNQVNKMTTMINGFLNVARLESGKIYLEKKLFQLEKLIEETIEEVASVMQHEDIYFLPCEPITINADYEKIGQVINNLLSNAIKYSLQSRRIEIACSKENDSAHISVKDEGIGIKQEHINKLFDRFYRVDGSQNQTVSGFGIGLYLAAEIVKRHDGEIWVESEVGKGSVFHFSLPLAE